MNPTAPPVNLGNPGTGTARYFLITRSTAAKPSRKLDAGGACSLHAFSLAAAPFPSPPLEERDRERRSLLPARAAGIVEGQAAAISPRTAASKRVMGLPPPTPPPPRGGGEARAPLLW